MSSCVLGSVQIKNVCVMPLLEVNPLSGGTETSIVDVYLYKYKEEIDLIDDVNEFRDFVLTRLIDVKSRKVINSYPLLRYLYDKYLNLCGSNICDDLGNQYTYESLNGFVSLIGDYWIDLIEQLVPSTSIWRGATKYYKNTVFDQPKFKYKNYSLLTCTTGCTTLSEAGFNCETTIIPSDLESSKKYFSLLTNESFYKEFIVKCWLQSTMLDSPIVGYEVYRPKGLVEGGIPEYINNCLKSDPNYTLDYGSIYVSGYLDDGNNTTIFKNLVFSSTTLSGLTLFDQNTFYNQMYNSLSNYGFNISYSGENVIISSTDENDCGKILGIEFCVDLNLSCVSGGTNPNCVPYTDLSLGISKLNSGSRAAFCPTNNSLYLTMFYSLNQIVGTNLNTEINLNSGLIYDLTYNPNNDSLYVLCENPYGVVVVDCLTNTITTTITLPGTFSTSSTDSSRIVYDSNNDYVYYSHYSGLVKIDCTTNTVINNINYNSSPYVGYQITYSSYDDNVYIANGDGTVLVVSNNNFITPIWVGSSGNYGVCFNPTTNKLYSSNINNGVSIVTIDLSDSNSLSLIPTSSPGLKEVFYNPFDDNVLFVNNDGSGDYLIIDTNDTIVGTYNSPIRLINLAYNSVDQILYGLGEYQFSIICLGGSSSTGSTTNTITASCESCFTVLNKELNEVYYSGTPIFDCNKCAGYENGTVQVIIETTPLILGTGSTQISCIEISNRTICDSVYIKSIDDDVIYNGKITI